jgi:hypothetical protein
VAIQKVSLLHVGHPSSVLEDIEKFNHLSKAAANGKSVTGSSYACTFLILHVMCIMFVGGINRRAHTDFVASHQIAIETSTKIPYSSSFPVRSLLYQECFIDVVTLAAMGS